MKGINIGDKVVGIAGTTRVAGTVLNVKEGHAYIKAPVSGVYAPIVRAVPLNKVTKLQESYTKAKMPERDSKDDDSGMDDYLATKDEEEKKKEKKLKESHMKASIPERDRKDDDGGMSDYEADHAEQEEKKKKKEELEEGLFSSEPKTPEYYRKLRQQSREENLKRAEKKGITAPTPASAVPKAKTNAEIEMADSALRKTQRSKGYDPRNTNTSAVSSKYKQMWTRKARYDAEKEAAGKAPSKVMPAVTRPASVTPPKASLKDRIKGFFKLKEQNVITNNVNNEKMKKPDNKEKAPEQGQFDKLPIIRSDERLQTILGHIKKISAHNIGESTVRKPNHTHAVTKNGEVVSYHTSRTRAHAAADRLDNAYGKTIHSVKPLDEGVFSAVRDFVTGGPKKSPTETRKAARAENLARAKKLGMKPATPDSPFANEINRGSDIRSEYSANRALTNQKRIRENAMLMISGTRPVKVIKSGVKGNGKGNTRTHTGQRTDDVAIYKESKDD